MKTKLFLTAVLVGAAAISANAGVRFGFSIGLPLPVIITAPVVVAPAPVEPVMVPDSYIWDGVEFVGVVGDRYFYLGPGNVWLACDRDRLARFHGWERYHSDWRAQAIRNDRFRNDAHEQVHGQPSKPGEQVHGQPGKPGGQPPTPAPVNKVFRPPLPTQQHVATPRPSTPTPATPKPSAPAPAQKKK